MTYLPSFKLWLINKKYSQNTIKSYITEFNLYSEYVSIKSAQPPTDAAMFFTESNLNSYFSLSFRKNSHKRTQAFLNLFCQFGLENKYIVKKPIFTASEYNNSQPLTLTEEYKRHLEKKHASLQTIKSYLNDIEGYLSWLDTPHGNS